MKEVILVRDEYSGDVECVIIAPRSTYIDELKNKLEFAISEFYKNHTDEDNFYDELFYGGEYDDILPYDCEVVDAGLGLTEIELEY